MKMDTEMEQLKSTLKSLVVSSPTQIDMRSLMRDYKLMMGENIPIGKYGYRDMVQFLTERCSDCFVLTGVSTNPILTLVVPESLKHIDKFVQKQRIPSSNKIKSKRRSIPEAAVADNNYRYRTQQKQQTVTYYPSTSNNVPNKSQSFNQSSQSVSKPINNSNMSTQQQTKTQPKKVLAYVPPHKREPNQISQPISINKYSSINDLPSSTKQSPPERVKSIEESDEITNKLAIQNFFKKRMPMLKEVDLLDAESIGGDSVGTKSKDGDSGRHTSSSEGSSTRKVLLDELCQEISLLVDEHPEGIWCNDFMELYRSRFGREVPYQRLGCTSVVGAVQRAGGARVSRPPHAPDWLLQPSAAPPHTHIHTNHFPPPRSLASSKEVVDPDDALPGLDFDPSVFPSDCIHYVESIEGVGVGDMEPGELVEVKVAEVYSPSHLWLLRLGAQHDVAMETIMDEMTVYYSRGEGRDRWLSLGATRVGHYCAALYDNDWHRAVIVRLLDSDTVKVRHIDYGTVARVPARQLKPLLRRWCSLPAQAVRARLAGVRPVRGAGAGAGEGGAAWPLAAAHALLALVRDKMLVGNVYSVNHEENVLELSLIDTSTEEDVNISEELIRAGHAQPRRDSAVNLLEAHLFPVWSALESGETPNYHELQTLARLGLDPAYVDNYRRHVPLPRVPPPRAPAPAPDPAPQPASNPARTRSPAPVPIPASAPPPAPAPAPVPQHYASTSNLNYYSPPMMPQPYYFMPRPVAFPMQFPYDAGYPTFTQPMFPTQFPMPPPSQAPPAPSANATHAPPANTHPVQTPIMTKTNYVAPNEKATDATKHEPILLHTPEPNVSTKQKQPKAEPKPVQATDELVKLVMKQNKMIAEVEQRPACVGGVGGGEGVAVRLVDAQVFVRLAGSERALAVAHMSAALARAPAAAAGAAPSDLRLSHVDADVFLKLQAVDPDVAVLHMRSALARAHQANADMQLPAPTPTPPPGFENYTPNKSQ